MQWIKSVYIFTAYAGIALAVFVIQVFAEGEKAGLITLQVSISKCRWFQRGVLTGVEGLSYTQTAQTRRKEATADTAAEWPQHAVRKCSIYELTEHTAYMCPRRQTSK